MPPVVHKTKSNDETYKNRFELTDLQREFLQLYLPRSMGLRTTDLTDEKRSRTPKKP